MLPLSLPSPETYSRLQDYLTSVSVENWTAWEENEAAQLMTFLGLDHPGEQMKCGKTLDSLKSVFKYPELNVFTF